MQGRLVGEEGRKLLLLLQKDKRIDRRDLAFHFKKKVCCRSALAFPTASCQV
jgi:hypothetical protein